MASEEAGKPYSGPVDFKKEYDVSHVKGKTAIVTGGASGLGLGIAEALAEAGACVVLADLNEELGEKEKDRLKGKGHNVHFLKTDTTSYTSQLSLFKTTILTHSPTRTLDIVVPSAGVADDSRLLAQVLHSKPSAPSLDADPVAHSMTAFKVNLAGVYISVYLALYYFKATATARAVPSGISEGVTAAPASSTGPGDRLGGGTFGEQAHEKQILFIASLAGYGSWPSRLCYPASKYAVRGMWKSLRSIPSSSLGFPFRTNLLAPTFVTTPLLSTRKEQLESLGVRVAKTKDVVDAAMRCLCDKDVRGRSLCVVPGVPGVDGTFDTRDDEDGGDGGPEVTAALKKDIMGKGFNAVAGMILQREPDDKIVASVANTGEAQSG